LRLIEISRCFDLVKDMQKVAQLVLNFNARDMLPFGITEYPLEKLVEPFCCVHAIAPSSARPDCGWCSGPEI